MRPPASATALPLLAVCLLACDPSIQPADLVLHSGRIVTLDPEDREVAALAARDGRIVALGDERDVAPHIGEHTRVLDLQGRLAVPGLIESHGHFLGLGDARLQLDLRHARSWEEIVEQVRAAATEREPGEWIRGRGWHQDKWDAPPDPAVEGFPVHDALSEASPENPVLLTHASGHAAFGNALALELAGIGPATPDPQGGEVLRDSRGRATGLLRETAQALVARVHSSDGVPPEEEARRMVRLASEAARRNGVTTFVDAGSSLEAVDMLRRAAEEGLLGVRLWVMIRDSNERLARHLEEYRVTGLADHMLSVAGIKLSIDGALGSRGAWMLQPYSDQPDSTGLNLVPLPVARETARLALRHDYQLAVHAIGDRANREVLDLYREAFAEAPVPGAELRWRIEHAQHLHPDDIPRFGELGVIASVQPIHCVSDAPWVPDRIGQERAEQGAYIWRDLLDTGATLVSGTDVPVEPLDPVANFHAAVTRRLADGGHFHPEQAMTRMEALRTYTLDGAWATFQEDLKGSLEVGKLADVTVFSRDLLEVPEEEIPGAEVVYTVLGGELVYEAAE